MKNVIIQILILIIPLFYFAQVKGIVLDSISKEKLPYVNIWIPNTDKGTTSNEDGTFLIKPTDSVQTIVFSAIGYQTKRINSGKIKNIVLLNSLTTELEEIELRAKKETKEKRIETFKKSKMYSSWATSPSIVAKLFKYKKSMKTINESLKKK